MYMCMCMCMYMCMYMVVAAAPSNGKITLSHHHVGASTHTQLAIALILCDNNAMSERRATNGTARGPSHGQAIVWPHWVRISVCTRYVQQETMTEPIGAGCWLLAIAGSVLHLGHAMKRRRCARAWLVSGSPLCMIVVAAQSQWKARAQPSPCRAMSRLSRCLMHAACKVRLLHSVRLRPARHVDMPNKTFAAPIHVHSTKRVYADVQSLQVSRGEYHACPTTQAAAVPAVSSTRGAGHVSLWQVFYSHAKSFLISVQLISALDERLLSSCSRCSSCSRRGAWSRPARSRRCAGSLSRRVPPPRSPQRAPTVPTNAAQVKTLVAELQESVPTAVTHTAERVGERLSLLEQAMRAARDSAPQAWAALLHLALGKYICTLAELRVRHPELAAVDQQDVLLSTACEALIDLIEVDHDADTRPSIGPCVLPTLARIAIEQEKFANATAASAMQVSADPSSPWLLH